MEAANQTELENCFQAELELQFPGWPNDYRELTSMFLFEGISNDYPNIASSPVNPHAYLVPSSIGFVASLQTLSKAQRSKTERLTHASPSFIFENNVSQKTPVSVVVSNDPNDIIVKIVYESINDPLSFIKMDKDGIVTYCLFSDVRVPTKCYVSGYPTAKVAHELLNGTEWIPNVVYEGRLQCKFTWDLDEQTDRVTNLRGNFEFNKIVRFAQQWQCNSPREYKALVDLALRDAFMYSSPFGHPARPMFQPKDQLIPMLAVRIKAVNLWYFGGGIVLCPTRPRRLARISPGLRSDFTSLMFIRIEPDIANRKRPLPAIRDGQRIIANLWHNRLNNFYLVHSYVLADRHRKSGERDDHYQLANRLQLGAASSADETNNQFLVKVNNSIFKDFYSCEPLGFTLISDPKRLLRNASVADHLDGFPVWVCVETDELRLARCRITALADVSTSYSRRDRDGHHPDIRGHGILVVASTGVVFSKDHPQTRIRLMPADRCYVTIGDQFLFMATYYGRKKGFVVCGIQLLHEQFDEQFIKIESFKLGGDEILFMQKLKTHMRQWAAEGHDSPNFGPVADPEGLVREYVHSNHMRHWPATIDVLVCYNAEWMPESSSLMKVHSLLVDVDAQAQIEEMIEKNNAVTLPNLHSDMNALQGKTEAEECDCLETWALLRELLNEERATGELEPEMLHRMALLRDSFNFLKIANNV